MEHSKSKKKFGTDEGAEATESVPKFFPAEKIPEPEVHTRKKKYHTRSFKLEILNKIDNCTVTGGIGAILRKEGLTSSTVSSWRKQLADGKLEAQTDEVKNAAEKQTILKLLKENSKLKRELKKAQIVIDVQKKISQILDLEKE